MFVTTFVVVDVCRKGICALLKITTMILCDDIFCCLLPHHHVDIVKRVLSMHSHVVVVDIVLFGERKISF